MQHSNIFLSVDHIRINVLKMGCQHFTINTVLDKDSWKSPENTLKITYLPATTENPPNTRFYQNLYRFPKVSTVIWRWAPISLYMKHFISRKPQESLKKKKTSFLGNITKSNGPTEWSDLILMNSTWNIIMETFQAMVPQYFYFCLSRFKVSIFVFFLS